MVEPQHVTLLARALEGDEDANRTLCDADEIVLQALGEPANLRDALREMREPAHPEEMRAAYWLLRHLAEAAVTDQDRSVPPSPEGSPEVRIVVDVRRLFAAHRARHTETRDRPNERGRRPSNPFDLEAWLECCVEGELVDEVRQEIIYTRLSGWFGGERQVDAGLREWLRLWASHDLSPVEWIEGSRAVAMLARQALRGGRQGDRNEFEPDHKVEIAPSATPEEASASRIVRIECLNQIEAWLSCRRITAGVLLDWYLAIARTLPTFFNGITVEAGPGDSLVAIRDDTGSREQRWQLRVAGATIDEENPSPPDQARMTQRLQKLLWGAWLITRQLLERLRPLLDRLRESIKRSR